MTQRDPRCLLLHGFTGSAADWQPFLTQLPPAFAIDLPGHGQTPDPRGGFQEAVQAILQALPDSIDSLIGYSLGGRIALGLIQAAPQHFRQATLLSAHPGLTDPRAREERRRTDRHWIQLLRTHGIEAFVQAWEAQPLFATQHRLPTDILTRQRAHRLSHRAEGLARCLECLGLAEMPGTWEMLTHFPGRLRWIVGGADPKFLAIARQVSARRPATDLHVLAGIGHNPLLEAPERLKRVLSHRHRLE